MISIIGYTSSSVFEYNCNALRPSKCDVIPDKDENGKTIYTSYMVRS